MRVVKLRIGFYEKVFEDLLRSVPAWKTFWNHPLKSKSLNRQTFSDRIQQWKEKGKLSVLCLDDFESILKYPKEFDNGFFDNLQSLMEDNALMLVLTSRKKLNIYGDEHRFVSSFFNVAHTIELEELTTDDAIKLVRLSSNSSNTPVLSVDEQNHAQRWGKRHPYKLQLAGFYLVQARQQGKSIEWAKKEFSKQIADSKPGNKKWWRWIWNSFSKIGAFGLWLADVWNNGKTAVLGIVIVVIIVLAVVGVFNLQQIFEFLKNLLNLVK